MRRITIIEGMGKAGLLAGALGCGGGIPEPRLVPHAPEDFVDAPSMPPPGRIETLPPRPEGDAVWVDGSWTLLATRWTWQYGYWAVPPNGAVYTRWTVVRLSNGTLRYAPGLWRSAERKPIPAPRALAWAREAQQEQEEEQREEIREQQTPNPDGEPGKAPEDGDRENGVRQNGKKGDESPKQGNRPDDSPMNTNKGDKSP